MGKNLWDRGMSGNAEKATVEEEHLIWYLIWPEEGTDHPFPLHFCKIALFSAMLSIVCPWHDLSVCLWDC